MNKYKATPKQIRLIKEAIKLHDMRGITWQSVAARPATINQFLLDAGLIEMRSGPDPVIAKLRAINMRP